MQTFVPGDSVLVKTKEKTYTGIVMPNENTDALVLKVESGYNVGIEKEHILEAKVLKKQKKAPKKEKQQTKKDPKKPIIVILHTGGTIASKVDYTTGGVVAKFGPEDLLELVPELKNLANVETDLLMNKMSEDLSFDDYRTLIKGIKKYLEKDVAGIIIGHGTDTLAYSAAALSFALENINIPVLIVGAQRSSDRGSTDAVLNIMSAAYFIINTDFAGVAVCMHESINDDACLILPACKTRKFHTSRRDAFKPVNDTPIARVKVKEKKIDWLKKEYQKRKTGAKVVVRDKFDEKVALIKTHINMSPEQFLFYKEYRGLVIEGTGLGHMPIGKNDALIKAIKQLIDKGTIVAMTSQCIFGRVHPSVYTNLRKVSGIGVLYSEDMLPETAFIKLSWLLGNFPKDQIKDLYQKNIRGEIKERLSVDHIPSFDE